MMYEGYKDTIKFDKDSALRFVKDNESTFSDKTIRRVVYNDAKLIIVKEISYYGGRKIEWYWGFTKDKRGVLIVEDKDKLDNKKSIELLRNKLCGFVWDVERVRVDIEGKEYRVSNKEELIEKIWERAEELGMKTFLVKDGSGNKLAECDITMETKITLEKITQWI